MYGESFLGHSFDMVPHVNLTHLFLVYNAWSPYNVTWEHSRMRTVMSRNGQQVLQITHTASLGGGVYSLYIQLRPGSKRGQTIKQLRGVRSNGQAMVSPSEWYV